MTVLTAKVMLAAGGLTLAVISLAGCGTSGLSDPQTSSLGHSQADQRNNIASISAVVSQNPRDANALNLRGTAYGQSGDYEKAIADFSAAIQVNPQYYQAYNNRALIYLRVGRLEQAMADYNQAISIKPDYAAAYVGRGNVYKDQKNYPAAIADFGRAIELKADDPAAYYARGLIFQAMNDHRSALDDLSVAVNYRPDAPDPHFARGISYLARPGLQEGLGRFPGRGHQQGEQSRGLGLCRAGRRGDGRPQGSGARLSQGAADQLLELQGV